MRRTVVIVCAALSVATSPPGPTPAALMTGIFTNEEEVYFAKEEGGAPPPWFAMQVITTSDGLLIAEPDAFGQTKDDGHSLKLIRDGDRWVLDYGACQRIYRIDGGAMVAAGMRGTCRAPATVTRVDARAITLTYPDGKTSMLRRARPATCWVSVKKDQPKPDGSEDWTFDRDVKLHDQGGRALVGEGVAGAKPVVIRMRNVNWGQGNRNRPSLVLYVHTPDDPDRAVSYAWADPGAARIGINLRWVQASCTIDGMERSQ